MGGETSSVRMVNCETIFNFSEEKSQVSCQEGNFSGQDKRKQDELHAGKKGFNFISVDEDDITTITSSLKTVIKETEEKMKMLKKI